MFLRRNHRGARFHHRVLATAARAGIGHLAAFAAPASAQQYGYTFDLRVAGTGAKEVVVQDPGDTVTLELFVHVRGADSDLSNDGLNDVLGGFSSSTGRLLGDMAGLPPPAPFNLTGSSPGRPNDIDGDGDLDIGSNNYSDFNSFYFARGGGETVLGQEHLVGRVRFSAFSLTADSTNVNWWLLPNYDLALLGDLDGAGINANSTSPLIHYADPVTIRAANTTGGGTTTYLSGTIEDHVVVDNTVRPANGTTLILNRGITVNRGGLFDSRDGTGNYGPHEIRINDTTSGNEGGALFIGNLKIGVTSPGLFAHNRGLTKVGSDITLGVGAPGTLTVAGGTVLGQRLTVGSSADGAVVHSNGQVTVSTLTLGSSAQVGSTYDLSGPVDTSALTISRVASIGSAGNGQFRQSGGQSSFNGTLMLGAQGGRVELSGGLLAASNTRVQAGGLFTQSGGTFSGGFVSFGDTGSTTTPARYDLQGGTFTGGSMYVGNFTRGTVHQTGGYAHIGSILHLQDEYDLSDGTLNAWFLNLSAPTNGQAGLLNQTGGFVSAEYMWVYGTYRITGGSFSVNRELTIFPGGTIDFGGSNAAMVASTNSMLNVPDTGFGNTGNASLVGQVDSLINYPAGFVLTDHFGHVTTQGLLHEDFTPLHIPAGRTVGGVGTIHGNVTNDGRVIPGYHGGAMAIDGSFTQSSDASLLIEIGGTSLDPTLFDALQVSGPVSLDGSLTIQLLNGFLPTADDAYTIVGGSTQLGRFLNAQNTVTFDGGMFDVSYTGDSVVLSNFQVIPEPSAAAVILLAAGAILPRRRRT